MSRQVINDGNGKPVSVLIDYQEWLRIEQLLEGKELNFAAPANPLDWYVLTETTNSVLNELIAYTSRERRKEMKQVRPDLAKIKLLEELFEEVHSINSNPENFKSIGRMESIIGQYAPKLTAIHNAA
ncbi:hypothetical protein [Dyadobacter sp. MSC1_007]|jgi:hypothetical protein|uniref:hypothetical protein n=1 Tax=Dyadobacter sp. MSC1_007 TaxID=2909264 RepID=UPI00203000E4|nr:hypothetical protein [Dyadobacter sp. MSC1_007]